MKQVIKQVTYVDLIDDGNIEQKFNDRLFIPNHFALTCHLRCVVWFEWYVIIIFVTAIKLQVSIGVHLWDCPGISELSATCIVRERRWKARVQRLG